MRFGQYEEYYENLWEGSIYDEIPMDYNGVEDWPSETRFIAQYLEQQGESVGEIAAGSGGILNIVKSILGIATPVVTSMLTASQQQATQQSALQRALTTSSGLPTSTLGASLSGLTSNLPLLAGIGVLGYFLFRGKGDKRPPYRRRSTKRRR